jgi:hypothetical protein
VNPDGLGGPPQILSDIIRPANHVWPWLVLPKRGCLAFPVVGVIETHSDRQV